MLLAAQEALREERVAQVAQHVACRRPRREHTGQGLFVPENFNKTTFFLLIGVSNEVGVLLRSCDGGGRRAQQGRAEKEE